MAEFMEMMKRTGKMSEATIKMFFEKGDVDLDG